MTNMPWATFRSDKMPRFCTDVRNAFLISGHMTPREAMAAAETERRADLSGRFTYWVADSQYPADETRSTNAATLGTA